MTPPHPAGSPISGRSPIVECVPNISEGRRTEVIDAIAGAVTRVGGARLIDLSCDPDHNRSVLTMAGSPDAVRAAVEALVAVAVERIDLRRHAGSHPRMGAVDVIPFVPVRDVAMEDCVRLAREVGAAIAARHGLPVYLYEAAASAPHRRNLAEIRRGEFEGFAEKIRDPRWAPDFGPDRVHPSAGCTAVGARPFLIAFNVDLRTPDVEVAKAIARVVRESSGGLPCVKALGLFLEDRGCAQVSMNLTDYRTTPIPLAFEAVRDEAARRGVEVAAGEIVGLVPEAALLQVVAHALRLTSLDPSRILEHRIDEALRGAGRPAGDGGDL